MRLAVQLDTLRHLLEDDLEATPAALAEVGAREVELDDPSEHPVDDVARSLAAQRDALP